MRGLCAFATIIMAQAAVPAAAQPVEAGQVVELTLTDAVRLAREHAPEIDAARADVAVADARVEGARVWRRNPSASVTSGPRFGDRATVDVMVGLKQPIAPGGRPQARADVARARQRVAELASVDEERDVALRAAGAYIDLLYWHHRGELAARNLELVTEVERVASRRKEVGDVGALDPSVAALARARAESDLARIRAARIDAESELRWLLGLDDSRQITIAEELATVAVGMTETEPAERSDVRLARARVDVATARQRLATRDRVPRLAVGAVGGREESATVVKGVFEFTLPLFWRGQPELLESSALEEAHREKARVAADRARHELRAATRKVAVLEDAVARFRDEGLAAVDETAAIASASYRAGAIALPELLVVRRELVAAEEEFAQLLLLAARARVERLASSGAFDSPDTTSTNERTMP